MHRVILIEDDPMVLEVNRQFVERVPGFEIVGTSSNGVDGIEKVRDLKPDLVILDIYMPGQNGTEVLQQIRNEQLGTDAIVITAANDIPTIKRMLQQGAVDYIMKPFKFERVQEALENYRTMKRRLGKESTLTQVELDQLLHGNEVEQISKSPSDQHANGFAQRSASTDDETSHAVSDAAAQIFIRRRSSRGRRIGKGYGTQVSGVFGEE